jgi:hypothetical protein
MKYSRRIYIREQGFPSDLYKEIVRLKPECHAGERFMLEAKPGDEANGQLAERIAAMCQQRGLKRTSGDVGTYGYTGRRYYEADDLLVASFFILRGQKKIFKDHTGYIKRNEVGRLVIPASEATKSVKLGSIYPTDFIVVSNPVRCHLENDGLIGLQFAELVVKGTSIHGANHPFWELKSSVILPKMVNSIIDPGGQTYGIRDFYFKLEPHYRQSELAAIGRFDVAYALEPHQLIVQECALIISQKFYQCCLRNDIPLEVTPVRIDPN